MKKIKFLNGISAVFALAVVALATTLTSCVYEEFNVNVTPTNAQAVISPIVLAIEDGVTTDVTGQATIAPAELTFTGNPTLAAKSVDVTASYNGLSATVTVKVPALQAGQFATLTPTIILQEEDAETKIVAVPTTSTDEKTKENLKSENIQSTIEEADLSDIIGYAEYLGKQKMRLFNSPNSETIYIIKKGENRHGVCFIVDSTNVQKAIKNKTVCLDPLCNIIKGSQQSAIDIKTINPGIVQLEQGNIYKVIEKANIELIS